MFYLKHWSVATSSGHTENSASTLLQQLLKLLQLSSIYYYLKYSTTCLHILNITSKIFLFWDCPDSQDTKERMWFELWTS